MNNSISTISPVYIRVNYSNIVYDYSYSGVYHLLKKSTSNIKAKQVTFLQVNTVGGEGSGLTSEY